jgi:phosphoglycerate kinase
VKNNDPTLETSDVWILTVYFQSGIPDGWMGLDIGPKSVAANIALIASAKTIVWNGPQGVFEFPNFAKVKNHFFSNLI